MYFTYVLYFAKLDFFYKGHTNNIKGRFERHNSGSESFTKKGFPWLMLWYTEKPTKSEAYKLEVKLKNLSQRRLVTLMLKHADDISSPDALHFLMQWSGC